MSDTVTTIVALHERRKELAAAKAELAEAQRRFDDEHLALLEIIESLGREITAAEADIRNAAVEVYDRCGNKQPWPGVGVRVSKALRYDPAGAFNWAKNHNLFIVPESLDTKAFERFGRDNYDQICDIAEIIETPTATIATDLTDAVDSIDVFAEEVA